MALVLRRLQRLLRANYSNTTAQPVQFIGCSATISNPLEHAMRLVHLEDSDVGGGGEPGRGRKGRGVLHAVTKDGSPSECKDFLIWRSDRNQTHIFGDIARLLVLCMRSNLKTVVFCKVRKSCEMVLKETKALLDSDQESRHLIGRLRGYRGGYQAELRRYRHSRFAFINSFYLIITSSSPHHDHLEREIEAGLFSGNVLGVIATNALELGIDVGDLDVTLHFGFPTSLASLWQQAGRGGLLSLLLLMLMIMMTTMMSMMFIPWLTCDVQ